MNTNKKVGLLGATFLTAAAAFGAAMPAYAQEPTDACPPGMTPALDGTCEEEDEAIVVTGSRLRQNAFTSASPVGVITAEDATLEGLANAAEIIQQSPATGGAFQINTQLTGFVTTGGPGAQTIGLRGLGAERTLVLMNGHRLGPAGTRGTVGPVDLSVFPSSLLQRIEILKDGASSVYGSDAIAGVVNYITRTDFEGIELNVFSNFNEFGGGEQQRASAAWGTAWNGGYFNIGAEYFQQEILRNGDRDDLACSADYLFVANANGHPGLPPVGERIDYPNLDPGQPHGDDTYKCFDRIQRLVRTEFGDLIYHDPGVNYAVPGNNSPIAGMARQTRAGFPQTFPYAHVDSPLYPRASAVSPFELTTIAANFGLDLGASTEFFGEFLFNRRESEQFGVGQFFPAVNPANPGNTIGVASVLPVIPRAIISHQEVEYTRALAGVRGDFGGTEWDWEVYAQASHSDAVYGGEIFYNDRVIATTQSAVGCNQAAITISGGNCGDLAAPIPWTSARILNGEFNANERAFLMADEIGTTTYDQRLVEAFARGPLFDLPAGSVEAVIGASYRQEEIDDTPSANEQAGNYWGLTSAGRTTGDDTVTEFFAEAQIPLLADQPFFESLDLSLSGRLVDYDSYGEGDTYKVGLNWRVFPDFRIRASTGTSFRAPALYELFLGNQTSFLGQVNIDPCQNWGVAADATLQANCNAHGVPSTYLTAGTSSATIFTGGGAGNLEAETSEAQTVGVIWTPAAYGLDGLSVAVDYFDIIVNDEITTFGAANVINSCYTSLNGPAFGNTDPFCALFTRNNLPGWTNPPGGIQHQIVTVQDNFVNIAHQGNRGIDLNLRYERDIGPGEFTFQGEATFILEDVQQIFLSGDIDQLEGTTFRFRGPDIVARSTLRYDLNDWTYTWTTNYIGEGSDDAILGGDTFFSTRYCTQLPCSAVAGTAPIVRAVQSTTPITYHDFSLRRRFENENGADIEIILGMLNIFDERPPSQSTGQFRRGTASLNGYDLVGRRAFFNVGVAW